MNTANLAAEVRFTLDDCRNEIEKKQREANEWVCLNVGEEGTTCPALHIPDNGNAWNVFCSLVDQYYQREKETARERLELITAKKEVERLTADLEKEQSTIEVIVEIADEHATANRKLSAEIERLKDTIKEQAEPMQEDSPKESPWSDLMEVCDVEEWVSGASCIIDELLLAADYIKVNATAIFYARQLQRIMLKQLMKMLN